MLGDGEVPPGFERVAEVLDALRGTRVVGVADRMPVHQQQALNPVPATVSTVAPPAPLARRRPASLLLGSLLVLIPVVAGLIVAGALPEGAQRFTSDLFDSVGISVPSPDDDDHHGAAEHAADKNEDAGMRHARSAVASTAPVTDGWVGHVRGQPDASLVSACFRNGEREDPPEVNLRGCGCSASTAARAAGSRWSSMMVCSRGRTRPLPSPIFSTVTPRPTSWGWTSRGGWGPAGCASPMPWRDACFLHT
jgi:hypothetical protein